MEALVTDKEIVKFILVLYNQSNEDILQAGVGFTLECLLEQFLNIELTNQTCEEVIQLAKDFSEQPNVVT